MTKYTVEIYRGEAPGTEGVELEDWLGDGNELDDATWAWLKEQGYGTAAPDLWVNIVPTGAWAPSNRPLAQREITKADGDINPHEINRLRDALLAAGTTIDRTLADDHGVTFEIPARDGGLIYIAAEPWDEDETQVRWMARRVPESYLYYGADMAECVRRAADNAWYA